MSAPGRLQACGCYDGPFSRERPIPIALRCEEHRDDPRPLSAAVPLVRDADGVLRLATTGQAVPV